MHIAFIAGGLLVVLILVWLLSRGSAESNSLETKKSVLSSDTYTKVVLTIIAIATSVIALQGWLN